MLYVFQTFQTVELVEKIRRSAKAQLCGVAIVLLHGGLSLSFICVHRLACSNQHIHKIFKHVRPRKILFFLKSSANSMVPLGRCRHRPLRVVSDVFFQLPTSPDSGSHHAFSDTPQAFLLQHRFSSSARFVHALRRVMTGISGRFPMRTGMRRLPPRPRLTTRLVLPSV